MIVCTTRDLPAVDPTDPLAAIDQVIGSLRAAWQPPEEERTVALGYLRAAVRVIDREVTNSEEIVDLIEVTISCWMRSARWIRRLSRPRRRSPPTR